MREMKDSGIEWVGKIPKDWEIKRGKFLYDIQTGKLDANAENENGEYPFFTCSMYPKKIDKYAFDCEALLVAGNGLVGFTQYYNGKFNAYQRTYVLSNFKNINPHFLKYYVGNLLNIFASANSVGSVIPFIKLGDLENFCIANPNSKEQELIGIFLDKKCSKIDNIRKSIEEQIKTLEEYKKSLIMETVTKGLNPNVEMKDSGVEWIGQIPKEWEIIKIKYIANLCRGVFGHRPRNDPEYYDGEYPFIQTGDIANATTFITTYSQTLNEKGKKVSKMFKKGTIAMTLAANIGDVAILDFDAYFPDSVLAIQPYGNTYNKYLYYILSIMKEEFIRNAIISTQLNLNNERVGNIKIPFNYNIIEQQQIIDYLDEKCFKIDEIIKSKKEQLETLNQYEKSLIYEYVTGKKEVSINE